MSDNTHIQNELTTGLRHHEAGRLAEARQIYERILATDPQHADALHLLGVTHHQQDAHETARRLIQKAIDIHPSSAIFHNNLGEVYRALGELAQAAEAYKRACELDPAHVDSLLSLGTLSYLQRKWQDAARYYGQAIQCDPRQAVAHFGLANTFVAQGRPEEAVTAYQQALRINENYLEAHVNLGNTAKALGEIELATAHYRRALELDPKSVEALANLGSLLFDQGRLDEAVARYQRALALNPALPEVRAALAQALMKQGRLEQASVSYASIADEEDAASTSIDADRLSYAFPPSYNSRFRPFIAIADFITKADAERIVALASELKVAHGTLADARVLNRSIRQSRVRQLHRNKDTYWIYGRLAECVIGVNRENWGFDFAGFIEELQYSEYMPEGHYSWHVDVGSGRASTRKLSLTIQLSDPAEYEGGELELHYGGETPVSAPRAFGTVVIFPSFILHRVAPVRKGLRRSLVGWVSGIHPFK